MLECVEERRKFKYKALSQNKIEYDDILKPQIKQKYCTDFFQEILDNRKKSEEDKWAGPLHHPNGAVE